MSWWLSHAAKQLRDQLNEEYPDRDKSRDGTIGDPAHAKRKSGHNPATAENAARGLCEGPASEPPGCVRAFDFAPPDAGFFVRLLACAKVDGRFRYLIHKGRIYRAAKGFEPERHNGAPHDLHVHASFDARADLDRRRFAIPALSTVEPVREAQSLLALLFQRLVTDGYSFPGLDAGKVDGIRGPRTGAALRCYQALRGIAVTGEADAATLESLRAEPRSFN